MDNKQLIIKYVNNPHIALKVNNLKCNNSILYSYNEPIGWFNRNTNIFYITQMKFSQTTTKHCSLLKYTLSNYNKEFKEIFRLSADFKDNSLFKECQNGTVQIEC